MVETKPPGRRERNRLERRRIIVDAATASFLANGYAGTSMSALVKMIGGSKETLWNYFKSKEELFDAVVIEVTTPFHHDLQAVLAVGLPVRPCLLSFCRTLLQRLESPDTLSAWRLIAGETGRFPELGRIFLDRAVRPTEQVLATFLAGAVAAGTLRGPEPEVMASMLLSLCWGRQSRVVWGDTHGVGYADGDADASRFVDWFMLVFAVNGRS